MPLSRYVGFIDLGIATVVLVTLVLPAREMYASSVDTGSETDRFALALAEARTMAHPQDGLAIDDLSRRLGAAGEKDWAIEAAVRGSERARESPTRWRALLAASVAFVDRLDVIPALDYANRALSACEAHQQACPSWEQIRMKLYQEHLDAGVKSGIDPHRGPAAVQAFRHAGESALRQIHLGGRSGDRGGDGGDRGATPAPTPSSTPGTGSNLP
jgi:hypothetical protein